MLEILRVFPHDLVAILAHHAEAMQDDRGSAAEGGAAEAPIERRREFDIDAAYSGHWRIAPRGFACNLPFKRAKRHRARTTLPEPPSAARDLPLRSEPCS